MTISSHTVHEDGRPTNAPTAKVVAATGGAAVGAAATTLAVWVFETATAIDLPTAVEGAVLVLVTAAVTYAAGWLTRPGAIR